MYLAAPSVASTSSEPAETLSIASAKHYWINAARLQQGLPPQLHFVCMKNTLLHFAKSVAEQAAILTGLFDASSICESAQSSTLGRSSITRGCR